MTAAFNLAQLANNLNTSGQLDATDGLTGIVPVANGGSGRSTLTANNILLGNGTSAVQLVAPGASGNVLTSNGTTWTSGTASFGALKYDLYTSGTTTWTCPTGVTRIKVICIGGGGGGCAQNARTGGNGGLAIGIYTVTPGTGYTATVGAGGAGTTAIFGSAASGGNSSLGSLISATGGVGATYITSGANGSGSSGNLRNAVAAIYQGNLGIFSAGTISHPIAAAGLTAPTNWAINSIFSAGASGEGTEDYFGSYAATGGCAGAIYIEYVG